MNESADRLPEPDLGPEPGWTACNPLTALGSSRSFVHGDDGDRIRIRFYKESASDTLLAKLWYGPGAEGPPGHAHGGALLAVLDEVAGGAVWAVGHKVVLARFEADMRRPVPLGHVVVVEGAILSRDGRKIRARGVIRDLDGGVYAESECLFIELTVDQREGYLEHARDDHEER